MVHRLLLLLPWHTPRPHPSSTRHSLRERLIMPQLGVCTCNRVCTGVMCVCLCVCVRACVYGCICKGTSLHVCMAESVQVHVHVYMCVCKEIRRHFNTSLHNKKNTSCWKCAVFVVESRGSIGTVCVFVISSAVFLYRARILGSGYRSDEPGTNRYTCI